MRPEFVEALENCMNFSSMLYFTLINIDGKGKAIHLLKPSSKHKRRREEMDEVKEEEELLKEDKQNYLQQVKKMKRDLTTVDEKVVNIRRNEELLNKLH
jgi:hypothetical protein